MKQLKFRARLLYSGQIVEGQLLYVDGHAHIIQDGDLEEDGHHIHQVSDEPSLVDEETITPVIDEEELEDIAYDYIVERTHQSNVEEPMFDYHEVCMRESFKHGFRSAMTQKLPLLWKNLSRTD